MEVTEDEVRHVAALARLALPEEAIPQLAGELRGILAHMGRLRAFGEGAPGQEGGSAPVTPLRADEPRLGGRSVNLAAIAPAARDGFFLVPQVVAHAPAPGQLGREVPDAGGVGAGPDGDA